MSRVGESEADRLRFCRLAFVRASRNGITIEEAMRQVRAEAGLAQIEANRRRIEALRSPRPAAPRAPAPTQSNDQWWKKGPMA